MIDFDKRFRSYVTAWIERNRGKYSAEELEGMVPEIYAGWADAPDAKLGCTPREYFSRMSESELGASLRAYAVSEKGIPSVLTDEVAARPAMEPFLAELLCQGNEELQILAANLLCELQSDAGFEHYLGWMTDDNASEALKDVACEMLNLQPQRVAERVLPNLWEYSELAREYLCDVLVNSEHDERIYAQLMEFFRAKRNPPLFSAYLGRYGDERALPELCRYFREEQLDYATYQELKNAIERLGGEAEGPERDFSRDPYYLAVHGGHEGHSCSCGIL